MLNLSLNLGINNVNRGVPPFKADLAFDWFKRDTGSLVLQNKVDGNDAAVVGGVRADISNGGYFKLKNEIVIPVDQPFSIGFKVNLMEYNGVVMGGASNAEFIYLFSAFGIRISDTIDKNDFTTIQIQTDVDTHIKIHGDGVNVTVEDLTQHISETQIPQFENIKILYVGRRSGGLPLNAYLWDLNINYLNKYYLNGNLINSGDLVEALNYGVTFSKFTTSTSDAVLDAMDLGYVNVLGNDQVVNPIPATSSGINIGILGDSTIDERLPCLSVGSYIQNASVKVDISKGGADIDEQKSNWTSEMDVSDLKYIFIQIGINDLRDVETSAVTLARYQTLVDLIRFRSPNSNIILSTMNPCNRYFVDTYGASEGERVLQRWSDLNESFRGNGANPITGSDGFVDNHTLVMDDGYGSMLPLYDIGDNLHENDIGRQLIADTWDAYISQFESCTSHEGGKLHNLINSYICLNPTGSLDAKYDILDRINQTSASTDSVYYDSTDRITRSTYHISEMNQYTLSTYFNVGDKGKVFNFFDTNSIDDRNFAKEFLVYMTDKTNDDEIKVLKYTGDIAKAIDDGAGSYDVDGDGYVILTN